MKRLTGAKSFRVREALAGCRGAAMTKCFGDRLLKAVLQKHILSCRFVAPAQLAVATKHFLSTGLLLI